MKAPPLRLHRLLRPYWALLALAFVAMLVESGADLLEPWPLKIVLDHAIGSKPPPAWLTRWSGGTGSRTDVLNLAALAVIGLAILGAVSSYAQKNLSTIVGKRVGFDLRHAMYHHVQRLSLAFYDRQRTGDMVVRLTADIDAAEDFITGAVLGIVLDAVTLLGMITVMFYLDWRFSLIGLSIAPILFFIVYRFMRRIRERARDVKRKESELASVVQESIASARIVKAFAREGFEEARLDRQSRASVDAALKARRVKATLSPLVDVVIATGTCLVLYYGAHLVLDGQLTAGIVVVYVLYLGKMYKPIKDLSKTTDAVSKAAVAFERMSEILSTETEVRDGPEAQPAPRFDGGVAFERVMFGYSPDCPILNNINFLVESGQRAALVGRSGSGKSTLISLIPRLYDASGGTVRIDGGDVRSYTLQSLREQISFVLQDPVLFRASIAENIAYGKPGASEDEILRASILAHAHEFVARMPRGYETVLGERGETLSGGQRQRIAIARALIRNTPILLLDEPSAALDPESEELIFDGLATLLKGKTSITIAHRLATVRRADLILVLHNGTVVETGTHFELLSRNGHYVHLYRSQFQARDEAPASRAV